MAVTTIGNDVRQRLDAFLHAQPKSYRIAVIVGIELLLFYTYSRVGPWVPMGIFYLLNLYLATKYVGGSFPYVLAFVSAAGKTWIKAEHYPADTYWWQVYWQFISSYSIYTLFCYMVTSLLSGRRRAEAELDKLSQLNEAIIAKTDSGVMVFNDEGQCVVANDAAGRILGCPVEQLQTYNLNCGESWHAPALLDIGLETVRTGMTQQFTLPLSTLQGKEVWCVGSAGRINRTDGAYLLMMFTDISAFKAAEDAKRQANQIAAIALNRAGLAERKLISIGEETQQRIGRELHDDLGQHMTGIAFLSEVLFRKLEALKLEEMQDAAKITAMVNEAVSRTRQLAQGLYPAELKENGLCSMLEKFAGHVESMYRISCVYQCDCSFQVEDPEVAIHLFRIVQEAVSNAVKHGRAHSIRIRVVDLTPDWVLEIVDDGIGIGDERQFAGGGLGMRTMRYRAALIGASLQVEPSAGGGTRVAVNFAME